MREMRKIREMREMREMLLARLLGVTAAKLAMALIGFISPVYGWISRPIASDFTSSYWSRRFSVVLFSFYFPASSLFFLSGSLL